MRDRFDIPVYFDDEASRELFWEMIFPFLMVVLFLGSILAALILFEMGWFI